MPTSSKPTRRTRTTMTETVWHPHEPVRPSVTPDVRLDVIGSTWQVTAVYMDFGHLSVNLTSDAGTVTVQS